LGPVGGLYTAAEHDHSGGDAYRHEKNSADGPASGLAISLGRPARECWLHANHHFQGAQQEFIPGRDRHDPVGVSISTIPFARDVSGCRVALVGPANLGWRPAGAHRRRAILHEHFYISGFEQLLERRTLKGVVVNLAPARRREV
jgi:hypothetical protein